MKVPKAKKLSSGTWFIYLRLGGEQISVTGKDEKTCIRNAQVVKAEWLAKKRLPEKPNEPANSPTVSELIDSYLSKKSRVLSPSTILGYQIIKRNRFQSIMQRPAAQIADKEWQQLINDESALAAPKTVSNAFRFIRTVIKHETGHEIPMHTLKLPSVPPADTAFLQPEEIPKFVEAVKDSPSAVPALLALSSLRLSEISALRWEDIPKNPEFIRVRGAVVRGADFKLVAKKQNKNASSSRNVPVLIPELAAAIERDRKPEGPVLTGRQSTLRDRIHAACQSAGITDVTIHGLRHSFASLCYHLNVPEKIVMDIGGWADLATVHKIYTHIARSDLSRYKTAISDFYNPKPKGDAEAENAN